MTEWEEHEQNISFDDLVKSEIQDLDETLLRIRNAWGENPVPLTGTYYTIIKRSVKTIGIKFDERYHLSPRIKKKIEKIFYSDRWA